MLKSTSALTESPVPGPLPDGPLASPHQLPEKLKVKPLGLNTSMVDPLPTIEPHVMVTLKPPTAPPLSPASLPLNCVAPLMVTVELPEYTPPPR
ncbi:MAG: hypothetical protein HC828_06645 [Blastochloris sp.]|nr:hypothetical protein [Blastochloris sp.]